MNKIIIANWKIYLSLKESVDLAGQLKKILAPVAAEKEIVICPAFPYLSAVSQVVKGSFIKLGAQDVFWEDKGAYTGEVSPLNLKEVGCQYVILGHSEKRKYLNETNEMIHKKVAAVLRNNLRPIICVGEDWEDRQSGQKDYILLSQLSEILQGVELKENQQIVVAYEPVWAISSGIGIAAEPEEVSYANEVIRHALIDIFSQELVKNNVRIIYGGSVKKENISGFANLPNLGGFLIGSASLDVNEFVEVVKKV